MWLFVISDMNYYLEQDRVAYHDILYSTSSNRKPDSNNHASTKSYNM